MLLEIISGSREAVIEEMKLEKQKHRMALKESKDEVSVAKENVRKLNSDYKGGSVLYMPYVAQLDKLQREERKAKNAFDRLANSVVGYLAPSKVIPVRLEGHLYNLKFLEELGRKLKGYNITIDVDHLGTMFVAYKKHGSKGCLRLEPLSPWYEYALKEVPKAKALYPIPGGALVDSYRGAMR